MYCLDASFCFSEGCVYTKLNVLSCDMTRKTLLFPQMCVPRELFFKLNYPILGKLESFWFFLVILDLNNVLTVGSVMIYFRYIKPTYVKWIMNSPLFSLNLYHFALKNRAHHFFSDKSSAADHCLLI